jgi:hypothetical protein
MFYILHPFVTYLLPLHRFWHPHPFLNFILFFNIQEEGSDALLAVPCRLSWMGLNMLNVA